LYVGVWATRSRLIPIIRIHDCYFIKDIVKRHFISDISQKKFQKAISHKTFHERYF
jgi:hypothetical protein